MCGVLVPVFALLLLICLIFSTKMRRCLSDWLCLQRQTSVVITWTLACNISVHLPHPGVASTSVPSSAVCPLTSVPLCLGAITFAVYVMAMHPCLFLNSFCFALTFASSFPATHQFTQVCTSSPVYPFPSVPTWFAEIASTPALKLL